MKTFLLAFLFILPGISYAMPLMQSCSLAVKVDYFWKGKNVTFFYFDQTETEVTRAAAKSKLKEGICQELGGSLRNCIPSSYNVGWAAIKSPAVTAAISDQNEAHMKNLKAIDKMLINAKCESQVGN